MKLSNNTYDTLKFLITIVSPALVTLIVGLGALYGFNSELITGTLTLITTFLGIITGVSSSKYKKENEEE